MGPGRPPVERAAVSEELLGNAAREDRGQRATLTGARVRLISQISRDTHVKNPSLYGRSEFPLSDLCERDPIADENGNALQRTQRWRWNVPHLRRRLSST